MENNEHVNLEEYALAYCNDKGIVFNSKAQLGFGIDGTVWETPYGSAIKPFYRRQNYRDEMESYRRLAGTTTIQGCAVPEMLGHSDLLMVIEMTIVQVPFVLDFAKVYFDKPPDYWFDKQIRRNQHEKGREEFGDDWGRAQAVVGALEGLGIYYVDPRPANIRFHED